MTPKNEKLKEKKERINCLNSIVIAVMTSVLTITGVIIQSNIENNNWHKQQKFLNYQETQKLKVKAMESFIKLSNDLQIIRLELNIDRYMATLYEEIKKKILRFKNY